MSGLSGYMHGLGFAASGSTISSLVGDTHGALQPAGVGSLIRDRLVICAAGRDQQTALLQLPHVCDRL